MDEDDLLIARVAAGEDPALHELFRRHAPWLATRLRSVLPVSDVEDVLQETFLAVWRGARGYTPRKETSAGGWLWGIARRQAALLYRRRGPATAELTEANHAEEDLADQAIVRTDLAAAVASLGPATAPERQAWQLLYVEDRPVAEVARLTGVPEGTVKSRAHRARKQLRAALHRSPAGGGTS